MKVAVTGAAGGVGRALRSRVPERHEIVALSHEQLPVEDLHAVMQRLVTAEPDVIVHAAAMTSVDGCEEDPNAAYAANALGARNVALAASRSGALLVHLSTDYVFDGEKGSAYHEFDEPNPISVYGRSKLAGELEVRAIAPQHLIVRTSWVFGSGSDFVSRALARLAAGDTVPAIADTVGTPTYVGHLAERLLPLALSGQRGVVHLAGREPMTWFELLDRTVRAHGLPGEVAPQKVRELDRLAARPANSSLTSLVLPGLTVEPIPSSLDATEEILEVARGQT